MGRRRSQFRQGYRLDSGGVSELDPDSIALVLRAAEDLITTGGRSLLVKMLRGSQAKDVRPELRANPAYGVWKEMSLEEVGHRVDWCVEQDFLGLEYFGKLPLLVYRPLGLAIECRALAAEYFDRAVESGFAEVAEIVGKLPLPTQLALLDRIADQGSESGEAILREWTSSATKRIRGIIEGIRREWNGEPTRVRHVFDIAWLDESLGPGAGAAFERFQKNSKLLIGGIRLVVREHPGMMDADICNRLLRGQSSCLVTGDRSFHNALCDAGVTSFYCDPESLRISPARLPGVEPRGVLARLQSNTRAKADPSPSPERDRADILRRRVTPVAPAELKRLRTKRRRIRNYFGGVERMRVCTIGISMMPGRHPLIGIRIRISSNTDIAALNSTELYFREQSGDAWGAYVQLATLLLQLQLEDVPAHIHYDAVQLPDPESAADSTAHDHWRELKTAFRELGFRAEGRDSRNPHMTGLRRLLADLHHRPTNQIKKFDSRVLAGQEEENGDCDPF